MPSKYWGEFFTSLFSFLQSTIFFHYHNYHPFYMCLGFFILLAKYFFQGHIYYIFFFKLFLSFFIMHFALPDLCYQGTQTVNLFSTSHVHVSKLTNLVSFKTRYFMFCQQCFKNCSGLLYDGFCHQWLYNICIYMHISLFVTKHSLPC